MIDLVKPNATYRGIALMLLTIFIFGCQESNRSASESNLNDRLGELKKDSTDSDSLPGGSWLVFPPNANVDSILSLVEEIHVDLFRKKNEIVGTWIAESDTKGKWVFTSDLKCKRYYDNVLLSTYTYVISNTSPQCGETVPVEQYTSYLKLTKEGPVNSQTCYEINGITAESLSLRVVDRGGLLLFDRH